MEIPGGGERACVCTHMYLNMVDPSCLYTKSSVRREGLMILYRSFLEIFGKSWPLVGGERIPQL